jgi:hypothetical protein
MTAPLIMMGGHSDNREYELAVVREAIAAKTDPALGADIPKAAEHLLRVLDDCAFRDERGKLRSRGNSTDLGLFFYFMWRRIMRYGFDGTQRSEARRWTFYLPVAPGAAGATGTDEPWRPAHTDMIRMRVKWHLLSIVDCDVERREGLVRNDTMKARVMLLEVKCKSAELVSRAFAKMKMHLKDPVMLRRCGLPSPRSFHLELEREWAAGTERMEAERMEAERMEAERMEAERMEAERMEAERMEREGADGRYAPGEVIATDGGELS